MEIDINNGIVHTINLYNGFESLSFKLNIHIVFKSESFLHVC